MGYRCPLFVLCGAALSANLLLGGGTRAGFLSDVILQLLAIPLLACSIWRLADARMTRRLAVPLALICAFFLLALAQLVPLPPSVWTALPGRDALVASFALLGRDTPWMPLSIAPHATALSALSLIAPVALFLSVAQLDDRQRRAATLLVLAIGVFSAGLGLMQMAEGPESALRPFRITNPDDAVGLFANRNHFAALLCSLMLFAGAWAAHGGEVAARAGGGAGARAAVTAAGFKALVVLVAAQLMTGSRAGVALTAAVIPGAILVAARGSERTQRVRLAGLLLAAIAIAGLFATAFALPRIAARLAGDPLADARLAILETAAEAARGTMPFGAGLGTFVPAYAQRERTQHVLPVTVNRAHNDFVELAIEAGLPGLILAGAVIAWLAARFFEVWRRQGNARCPLDGAIARAASVMSSSS